MQHLVLRRARSSSPLVAALLATCASACSTVRIERDDPPSATEPEAEPACVAVADEFVVAATQLGAYSAERGFDWRYGSEPATFSGLARGADRIVALAGREVVTSTDGVAWTPGRDGLDLEPRDLAWDGGSFWIVGTRGGTSARSELRRSSDGVSFEPVGAPLEGVTVTALSASRGVVVAIGRRTEGGLEQSAIFQHAPQGSSGNLAWSRRTPWTTLLHADVAASEDGDGFVVVGAGGIQHAADGSRFELVSITPQTTVRWSEGRFVSIGRAHAALSPDGRTWDVAALPEVAGEPWAPFTDVASAGCTCLAVGPEGWAYSRDGVTWERHRSGAALTHVVTGLVHAD